MEKKFKPYDDLDERMARYEEMVALRATGLSYAKIGERYGLSRARVAQVLAKPPALAGQVGHKAKLAAKAG
jgi:hypothetical protein